MIHLLIKKGYWKLLVSGLFLLFIYHQNDFSETFPQIKAANVSFLLVTLIVFLIGHFFGQLSWYCVLRAKDKHIRFSELTSSYWQGLFFNNILPTSIGGDVVKGLAIIKKKGKAYFFVESILVDRIINFSALLMMGILSGAFFYFNLQMLLVCLSVFLAGFLAVLFFLNCSLRFLCQIKFRRWKSKLLRKLVDLLFLIRIIFKKKRLFGMILLSAILSQICKVSTAHWVAYSLGVVINPFLIVTIVMSQAVISLLPISIGGLGVKEQILLFFNEANHFNLPEVTIVSLLAHALLVLSSVPGIYFFYFSDLPFFKRKNRNPS